MEDRLSLFYSENFNRKEAIKRQELKREVIGVYSNNTFMCACCGEDIISILTIDHIDNNGAEHRKELEEQGIDIYNWLKLNNYPRDNYQVLCYNCNIGKYRNGGVCPHTQKYTYLPSTEQKIVELTKVPDSIINLDNTPVNKKILGKNVKEFIQKGFFSNIGLNGKYVYKVKSIIEYNDYITVIRPSPSKYIIEIPNINLCNCNIKRLEDILKFKKVDVLILSNTMTIKIKGEDLYNVIKEIVLKNLNFEKKGPEM